MPNNWIDLKHLSPKDRDRHEVIISALHAIGIDDFVLIGLRRLKEHKQGEGESFYAISSEDKGILVAILKSVFTRNLQLAEFLADPLCDVIREEVQIIREEQLMTGARGTA